MLKTYASYFVSYLLNSLRSTDSIQRIILYGSVARNEATKESDVDIFIEVIKKTSALEREIKEAEKGFYQSREATLFKTKGVDNKFSIKIGKLKGWQDLYKSIASTGIVLYGPYEAKELPSGVQHFILIFWKHIGKNRGSFLNKLYGFTSKERRYAGLVEKYQGEKIGKSCIMLPIQYKKEIFSLLDEYEVQASSIEVFK